MHRYLGIKFDEEYFHTLEFWSISPTCFHAAFTHTDPKRAKKEINVITVFLLFWDLRE